MKKRTTNYFIVGLLVFIFIAPGLSAYVFYNHLSWLSGPKTNKGLLLQPAVALDSVKGNKWRILFWEPKTCSSTCLEQLDVLARVRLALGRKLYQVEQLLLLPENAVSTLPYTKELEAKDFKINSVSTEDASRLGSEPAVFLMNPEHYLILKYQPGVNPEDVYKDLKTVLNAETKQG